MKYTITHTCGHETEAQLYGTNKDRERRIAAMERTDCPACRAKAANEESGDLPQLVGSDKQIAWAATIRTEKLAKMQQAAERAVALIADAEKNLNDAEAVKAAIAKYNTTEEALMQAMRAGIEKQQAVIAALETAKTETSAAWWIEHR